MKKILFAFAFIAIVSCTKSTGGAVPPGPVEYAVKFYSTNAVTATKVITVKVNGIDYGRLQYSSNQPACSAAVFAAIILAPGNYKADYIDPANPYATRQVSFIVPQSVTTCIFFDLK